MADDLNLAVRLSMRDQSFTRGLTQSSRRLNRFAGGASRKFAAMSRGIGRGLDKLGNKYTALLTGGTAFATGKYLANLDKRVTRLGTTAGVSAEKMKDLKGKVFDVAQQADVRVKPGGLWSAVESIVNKIGDADFAKRNLRNIGLAMQASGASGTAIGKVFAEMKKMGIDSPEEIFKALDMLNVQGKKGAFDLPTLARLGPQVMTAYNAQVKGARDPLKELREMGAALQIIRRGTKSGEEAATTFSAVLRDLTDPKKIQKLNKLGVQVFDPEAKKQGKEVLRPINELLVEIMKKVHGKQSILGMIFGDEARRAFNQVSAEKMREFYDVQADGSQTLDDASRNADTLAAALTSVQTALKKFADSNLTGYIQKLADAINNLNPERLGKILKALATFGAGVGGLVAARYLFRLGKWASTPVRRLVGKGGSGLLPGGIQKVYVVNMRGGGMPGADAGTATSGKRKLLPLLGWAAAGGFAGWLATGALAKMDNQVGDTFKKGRLKIKSWLGSDTADDQLDAMLQKERQHGVAREAALQELLGPYGNNLKPIKNPEQFFTENESMRRIEDAADSMKTSADRMANRETNVNVNVEFDDNGLPRVRHVSTGIRAVGAYFRDPYAGPMTAGGN